MATFPKTPSSKDLLAHTPLISNSAIHTNTTPFISCPISLSDSLSVEELSALTRMDVYYLRYTSKEKPVQPYTFFSYDNVISKPALSDAKSLVKQKKETDLLLYSLGLSSLTQNEHISFVPAFSSRVGDLFAKLFAKGCITNTYQSVFWNTRYQTIAPFENVRFETQDSTAYTVKYFVSTKNHSLDIYVQDPATIFGDVAIAINPLHKKAKILKWQMVIIPIINKTIPVIIDERADFWTHGWIMRITPAHDTVSLSIAKDHGLPLDVESFDASGNFSAHAWLFAGKPVDQFLLNITQNLSDIGNLIDKHPIKIKVPFSRITNEKLFSRTHKGRFLQIPQDIVTRFFEDEHTRMCFGEDFDEISSIFPVSTPSALGYRLPVWTKTDGDIIIVDEWSIIDAYTKNKSSKKSILLSLFIFHAIQEGNLNARFGLEDAIACFFAAGFSKDQILLTSRMELYKTRYPQYEKEYTAIQTIISRLNEDATDEKALSLLIAHLENSLALTVDSHWIFSLDLGQINPELADAIQSKETISTYLLHHLLVLDACGLFEETWDMTSPMTLFSEQERYKLASCTLLWYFLCDKFPWSKAFLFVPACANKGTVDRDVQRVKKYIQTYGSDVVRRHLMDAYHPKITNNEESLEHTMWYFQTFWNACRYIKTTLFEDKQTFKTLDKVYASILAWSDDIHAFDTWIIWAIQSIVIEHKAIETPVEMSAFSHRIFQFIKEDFSTKYLELIKISPSPYSAQVSLLIAGILIKMLFPYAPLLMSELWQQMWFTNSITDPIPTSLFPVLQKSYLISLFMDLIDKFVVSKENLACKKHDSVSIFIKANPDFLKFCKTHEVLLQKTLHAEDIAYLPYNEQAPSSYIQEDIIDITIGIKRFSKDNPFCLAALTKKLWEKQEYLQHLRNLLSSLNNNGWSPEILTKKREEIQTVKDEIEELELEINKLKMKE